MEYVIIGNGVSGVTAAAAIRKLDVEGKITLLTDEAYPFYSRIRLTEFLYGNADEKDLTIKKEQWYKENNINLILNTSVTDIDINKKKIITSPGGGIKYDRLLLATGGLSFVPPIPGAGKKGVFTLRTLKDAIAIREYNEKPSHNTLIIGGGVLGLEAGYGLMRTGRHNITVVEFFSRLLPRQMDPVGSEILERQIKKMGFSFYLGAKSREIKGRDKAEALIMEDGSTIKCDMIIISAGVRPNSALAQKLGLKIEKGLVVNDRMETGIPDIYAAGDLVQHNGICYGIWPAAEKQGETAGINMAGGNSVYQGTTISNTLKVAGIDLVAAGDIDAEGEKESITVKDIDNFIYKKIVIWDNRITGVILYGDIREKKKILRAIESGRDISGIKEDLEKWNLEGL